LPEHADRLAGILYSYLETAGTRPTPSPCTPKPTEPRACSMTGPAEATALTNLGLVCWRLGRHPEAIDHLERALSLFRKDVT
jgi:tetratricopeptide (TPR) repeat protein